MEQEMYRSWHRTALRWDFTDEQGNWYRQVIFLIGQTEMYRRQYKTTRYATRAMKRWIRRDA